MAQHSNSSLFADETSFPLSSESRDERVKSVRSALQELGNVQSHLHGVDPKWIGDLKSYITQLHTAPIAQLPKEQFDNLYHVRKMLLWAPVGIIRSRGVDMDTLMVLSYFYASALTLEPAYPDIGASFLSALVAPPLGRVLGVVQVFQQTRVFDPIAQMLWAFPKKALDKYNSVDGRSSWTRPSISVSESSTGFELTALTIDLANQTLPDQYAYTPGLSPAFAPSTLNLIPPTIVTQQPQRSPFLGVPTSSDSYYGGYSTSPVSYQVSASTYVTSPLVSPGLRSPSDASEYQLSPYHAHSRQNSVISTGAYSPSAFESYTLASQAGSYATSDDGVAGGLVLPAAVWT
jgi:hypothetical protein